MRHNFSSFVLLGLLLATPGEILNQILARPAASPELRWAFVRFFLIYFSVYLLVAALIMDFRHSVKHMLPERVALGNTGVLEIVIRRMRHSDPLHHAPRSSVRWRSERYDLH